MFRTSLAVSLVIGCGGSSGPRTESPTGKPSACPSATPIGGPADYHAPTDLPGITIAEPKSCDGEAYIRITRATGARRIGTKRGPGGGFDEGCVTMPADPHSSECPVINVGALIITAGRELEKQKIMFAGDGLGPCGNSQGDYDAWNMAVGVHDWNHAEAAVRVMDELLERYDLAGYVGVGVRGNPCGEPL